MKNHLLKIVLILFFVSFGFEAKCQEKTTETIAFWDFRDEVKRNETNQAEPRGLYTITFNVFDIDNQSITNAQIVFDGVEYGAGNYTVNNVQPGVYNYFVFKSGYDTKSGIIEVSDEDIEVDVYLNEKPKETITYIYKSVNHQNLDDCYVVTVIFDVVDEYGVTIDDAIVTFDDMGNTPGDYEFDNIEEGVYEYTVEKEGYVTVEAQVNVNLESAEFTLSVALYQDETYVHSFEDKNQWIKIYPNPNPGIFTLEMKMQAGEKPVIINVYDSFGRNVLQRNITYEGETLEKEINLSHLNQGIYLIQVADSQGKNIFKKQFVIY